MKETPMTQQGDQNGRDFWVVVPQPGAARLAGTAIEAVSASALTHHRRDTMVGMTATVAAWRANAEAEVEEPNGGAWSLKFMVKDSQR
jgi:hypothetical protein